MRMPTYGRLKRRDAKCFRLITNLVAETLQMSSLELMKDMKAQCAISGGAEKGVAQAQCRLDLM